MSDIAGPSKLLDAVSMAATVKSRGFRMVRQCLLTIQVFTVNSDAIGAWTVQGSNVIVQGSDSTADADWTTLTQGITNPPNSASAAENFTYELIDMGYIYIRLVWTRTAGTAASTITALAVAKSP